MWEINLNDQAETFLLSLVLGVIFCLCFDFTRGLRVFGLNSKIAVFFTDIIYFLVISFVNFCFFLTRESGQVRGYVFVGEIIGFFLFRLTLSKFIMTLISIINKGYKRAKNTLNKIKIAVYLKFKEKIAKNIKKLLKKG